MAETEIPVNTELLKWAREKSCLDLEEIVIRAKISDLKERGETPGKTAIDRLLSWEAGETKPTLRQLEGLAKAYRRPVLTFFLNKPPIESEPIKDFRTVESRSKGKSPEFAALLRYVRAIHDTLKEIAVEKKEKEKKYVGMCRVNQSIESIVESIRKVLGVSYEEQYYQKQEEGLFKFLREKAQAAGIYVLVVGDLGNYCSAISTEMFRGFAIADSLVPMVGINPNDTKTAQLFSLMHEVTHVLLGESGISNVINGNGGMDLSIGKVEKICNRVAGEFLVPAGELCELQKKYTNYSLDEQIKELAEEFRVSEMVIALKMCSENMITNEQCSEIMKKQKKLWEQRKRNLKKSEGGPSRNILDRYHLGTKLIDSMLRAIDDGYITEKDASRLLKIPYYRLEKVSR